MKFSIITVLYNNLQGLKNTSISVLNQNFQEYEWLIIDGKSNDGTSNFLLELKMKGLCKFISEKDNGIYDAMNKGIRMASGEYILFLNGGDVFYDNNVLEKVSQKINKKSDINKNAIYYGDFSYFFSSGKTKYIKARNINYIRHSLPTSHQAFFYPLIFLRKNQYDLKYSISSDYYLTAKAYIDNESFLSVEYPICKFEIGGISGQKYFKAIKEAYIIQRDILNICLFYRLVSASKRFLAYNIMRLINKYNL